MIVIYLQTVVKYKPKEFVSPQKCWKILIIPIKTNLLLMMMTTMTMAMMTLLMMNIRENAINDKYRNIKLYSCNKYFTYGQTIVYSTIFQHIPFISEYDFILINYKMRFSVCFSLKLKSNCSSGQLT